MVRGVSSLRGGEAEDVADSGSVRGEEGVFIVSFSLIPS